MRFGIREFIFLVVLLAVPVASFIYVFKPRNDEIRQARNEISVKKERLVRLEEMAIRIEDIGLEIEKGRESIELIEAKLPSEDDVAGILGQFTQLAKNNNMAVPSFKPQEPVTAAMYMELPIEMTMEGRFNNFYEFLLDLERLPRITRIHQMNMEQTSLDVGQSKKKNRNKKRNRPTADLPPGSMRADLTLSIYFASDAPIPD